MSDFVQCPEVFHITPIIKVECWRDQDHAPFLGYNYHEGQINLVGNRGAIVSWLSPSSTACATE